MTSLTTSVRTLSLALFFVISTNLVAQRYNQTNLVSNVPGLARVTDSNLQDPWGLAFSPGGPLWVTDEGSPNTDATLYDANGTIVPLIVPMSDGVPPTGIAFNGSGGFIVRGNRQGSGSAVFIFAGLYGTISGWSPNADSGKNSVEMVNNQPIEGGFPQTYTGLALAKTTAGTFLYVANFSNGTIDVYDDRWNYLGSFNDPQIPNNYGPFGIQNIKGKLFVTFAQQASNLVGTVPGAGHGFVDIFSPNGNLLKRFVSHGPLNSPWGVALAPASFGKFSDAILVGNFGDGRISAFDPGTGKFLGHLENKDGVSLSLGGVFTLRFGGGANAGSPDDLFFTTLLHPGSNTDGLVGILTPAP